jgi:hypothetical protein
MSIPFRVDASGSPAQPGLDLVGPLQAMPAGSLYLTIGFLMVIVSLLVLNRQKMELRERIRTRQTRH